MKYDWMKHIKCPEDFPEEFQKLAQDIGVKNALKVMEEFAGQQIYFFKLKEGFSHIWQQLIRAEYKKHNIKELALKYEVTVQTIRNIMNDHELQEDLFPRD